MTEQTEQNHRAGKVRTERLQAKDLRILTELFDYNDAEQMIRECARDISDRKADIFVMYDRDTLIGELHVLYESDNENYAVRNKRAYLYAFRVRREYQNKGYGTRLLRAVLADLHEEGYSEFTIGAEDDNEKALHIYHSMGFNELLLRRREEYQGDVYEYNLFFKRQTSV